MKVLVTGATGFVGYYVVHKLLERKVHVVATARNSEAARQKSWYDKVTFIEHDFTKETKENLFEKFQKPDLAIHLAWGGLANFKDASHIESELPLHKAFLLNLISNGLKDLAVTGTCLEYGMQEGELSEDMDANPTIAYPIAKNELRKYTEALRQKFSFHFKWIRLFYMYGEGQTPKSIIPQLQKALRAGENVFNMSKGEQVRDYLPVESIAENIVIFAMQHEITGIINCSSNKPVTVKQLVQDYLKQHNKKIELNTGFYPYTDYEPFKFWGSDKKQKKIISMNPIEEFKKERKERIESYGQNKELKEAAEKFNTISNRDQYSYNFSWMGRPIIQYPQDMVMMQELIWEIKPDLIIETGIAHGGSLIFYASIMELIGKGEILGVDIDIRDHNRKEIEAHPMFKRIKMIQGSAIDPNIIEQVKKHAEGKKTIMVSLDSNHTHEHVLEELKLYAGFTTVGSYCIVFDTIVEDLPKGSINRPWDVGNNPKTAVFEFLKTNDNFVIDKAIDNKLLISVAPDGYLKRIK
ncbi:MAG: Rhamnosyl O-methyltransferase [Bacteroidetes bacterium]|jgi:cephalosporin hydroxylase/nucleoside-diphosphate-sugar epimerase|nr:Rhamnosyl O-methyltransferase [Bacteroidota bacterium]